MTFRASKTVQWLRALAALPEKSVVQFPALTWQFTRVCNSGCWISNLTAQEIRYICGAYVHIENLTH